MVKLHKMNEQLLKGIFTQQEWSFLIDSLNATMTVEPFRSKASALAMHCEDAAALEGLDSKWGVDMDVLLGKINALKPKQVESLYDVVEGFWNAPHETRNLEEWASRML